VRDLESQYPSSIEGDLSELFKGMWGLEYAPNLLESYRIYPPEPEKNIPDLWLRTLPTGVDQISEYLGYYYFYNVILAPRELHMGRGCKM